MQHDSGGQGAQQWQRHAYCAGNWPSSAAHGRQEAAGAGVSSRLPRGDAWALGCSPRLTSCTVCAVMMGEAGRHTAARQAPGHRRSSTADAPAPVHVPYGGQGC